MSDFYKKSCEDNIMWLDHHLSLYGKRKMIEGVAAYLSDVKLNDAIGFVEQTDLYMSGEYREIDCNDFRKIFKKAGLNLDKSVAENALILSRMHISAVSEVKSGVLAFLSERFKGAEQAVDFKLMSDVAQLLDHVMSVVAQSPSCHADFEETKLKIASSDHINFLTIENN